MFNTKKYAIFKLQPKICPRVNLKGGKGELYL